MQNRLWQISEFPFQPERLNHFETLFTVGNGYLSTRGTFEERYTGDIPSTLVHGIYNQVEGKVPELVNIPNWLDIKITIDGMPLDMTPQKHEWGELPKGLLGYKRTLHMNNGLLRRELLFRAESGSMVRIVFDRFASMDDVHLLVQRVTITAIDGSPEIVIDSSIDTDVTNTGAKHWTNFDLNAHDDVLTLSAETNQSGYKIGMASRLLSAAIPEPVESETRIRFTVPFQQSVTVDKFTTIYTSRDVDNPLDAAKRKLDETVWVGYDKLFSANERAWADLWETSDIQIEGDDSAQIATRFVTYHILIAAPRHEDRVSIGAKTLSGMGYKGHVFWDTELFITPVMIVSHPEIARNLLMYRYHLLQPARENAKANGFEGAMFPWESTDTGTETTPKWSDPLPDGSRIRIWTGEREQHISTDIAYAAWMYWRWTGDRAFLCNHGAEIILDSAVFWGSRVEPKGGRYEISNQIGPDEYHENVDNSVFTNSMVVWHLQTALSLLEWLETNSPADAERLKRALDLSTRRLAHWRDVMLKMYIPFDDAKLIHIQFPGFFDMEYIPVPDFEPRTMSVQAILGHHRSTQTQVIKQADVVMLMSLLGDELAAREVLMNNWNTYYPRTDHGSSLSPAVHARVAAWLGMSELAYELFDHAVHIDLNDNKGNVRDGIHAAACGGVWQAVVFGFAGLHINEVDELAADPRLPAHWKRLSFTIYFRGEKRAITLNNTSAEQIAE